MIFFVIRYAYTHSIKTYMYEIIMYYEFEIDKILFF